MTESSQDGISKFKHKGYTKHIIMEKLNLKREKVLTRENEEAKKISTK